MNLYIIHVLYSITTILTLIDALFNNRKIPA